MHCINTLECKRQKCFVIEVIDNFQYYFAFSYIVVAVFFPSIFYISVCLYVCELFLVVVPLTVMNMLWQKVWGSSYIHDFYMLICISHSRYSPLSHLLLHTYWKVIQQILEHGLKDLPTQPQKHQYNQEQTLSENSWGAVSYPVQPKMLKMLKSN